MSSHYIPTYHTVKTCKPLNRILEEAHTDPMKKYWYVDLSTYLVLKKNYFTFNNNIYRQIQGTAMGTRMAMSYTNIFMKYIEIQLIDTSHKKPKMWLRFIDNIFVIWGHDRNELENFIHLANNLHLNYQILFYHQQTRNSILRHCYI